MLRSASRALALTAAEFASCRVTACAPKRFPQSARRPMDFGVMQRRSMARYEGEQPDLQDGEFVVLSPEVSGAGGMSVPAELGEISQLNCEVGDQLQEDQVVAVIDTCKASVEARCRAAGVVTRVLVGVDEEVMELHPLIVVRADR